MAPPVLDRHQQTSHILSLSDSLVSTQAISNGAALSPIPSGPPAAIESQLFKDEQYSTNNQLINYPLTTAPTEFSMSHHHIVEDEDYETLPENTPLTANLAAGAFAGIMEHAVMYPVDAIKTRMQVAHTTNIYSGIVNAMTRISSTEGTRSLWRGISSVFIGAGPAHAVYFAVYESVKQTLIANPYFNDELTTNKADCGNPKHYHSPLITSIAGASATTTSDALMNPFDVIKQRMQLFGSKYKSFSSCARDILKREGFKAFYVSYPTTLIMNVPFTATNFTVYESMSKLLNPDKRHDPLSHCLAGGVAGGCAAAITTPLDVIKTLLQTRGALSATSAAPNAANVESINSFRKGAVYIYRTAGLKGFMRGLRPRVVANMPSTAISWTSYEMAKFYIAKQSPSLSAFK